jgi:hypothetical protein
VLELEQKKIEPLPGHYMQSDLLSTGLIYDVYGDRPQQERERLGC